MDIDKQALKAEYNILLKRIYKAEAYLGSPNTSEADKAKWEPEFRKILARGNEIVAAIERTGELVNERQIWGGFEV